MLEILNAQFAKPRCLTQNKKFSPLRRDRWPNYFWELYPMAQEYYHEFNPFFLFNIYDPGFYEYYKIFTVRDGMITLANFLVNNFNTIPKSGANLFLVHQDFAPLIPPQLAQYFGVWSISRPNPIKISEAKKIVIFAFVCDQYVGKLEEVQKKLSTLKQLRNDVEIEVYLPLRRNLFETNSKESIIHFELLTSIHQALPGKKVRFLKAEDFMEKSEMKNTYVLDLARDHFFVSDNYLHYFVLSRGGTMSNIPSQAPKESIFDIALSFNHSLHISPLPKVDNLFTELLFYKKQSGAKDLIMDQQFQQIVREGLQKNLNL